MRHTLLALVFLLYALPAFGAERGVKRTTLSSPVPVATPYLAGQYRALVIGNDDYDDPERLWPSLKTAVADAEAVAELLRSEYGFAEITLLRNAKRRDIVRAFNRLAQTAQENDSVLIYYAGHGHLNEGTKEGFWIPVDAEGRDDSTFVRNSTIKVKLGVIADRARHVLLVSDSCFSGALLREGNRGVSLSDKNERYYQKVSKKKSVQILAAGGLEFVDDNYKGAGHSPFTYYLLQSLKDNNARFFEASDLSRETSRNVSINTVQTPESGVLQGAGHAGGEFFFLRTAARDTAVLNLPDKPGASDFSLDDLDEEASQEEGARLAWDNKLEEMRSAVGQVRGYERRNISPSTKVKAWRRFLSAFSEDNPYSGEDETLRSEAQNQIGHWQGEVQRLAEAKRKAEEEQKRLAEQKRKAEAERKREEELAAMKQKQESAGEWTEPTTGMKFRRIPGGSFRMGSPSWEKDRGDNERQHTVSVGEFWLGETEVTQAQWKAIMNNNPSLFKGDDLPVEKVSFLDVQKFIKSLNTRTGKRFRLPTEAEWEYAARAGTQTARYWSDGIGRNNANCDGCGSRWDDKQTAPVGSFKPNAFGLFDMLGNVWEWTCSEYKKSYDGSEQKCSVSASKYSLRGGTWGDSTWFVRAAYRYSGGLHHPQSPGIGFRLARDN